MDLIEEMKIIREKAALLKALSNPVRLCIVRELLQREECNVSAMQNCLKLSQSTVSQHLGRLRDMGIISCERKGTEVHYRIASEEAADIVKVLF